MSKQVNEIDIQKAVDETILEMNNKIKELREYKENNKSYENVLNDAINYLKNGVDNLKAYYEDSNFKSFNEEILNNLKFQTNNIYKGTNSFLVNLPDFEKIKLQITEKLKELEKNEYISNLDVENIKVNVSNGIEKLNTTTDNILYAARDLYDEYSEKEEVKNAMNTIKDTSKNVVDSLKNIIEDNIKNKG